MKTHLFRAAFGLATLVLALATPATGTAQYRSFTQNLRPFPGQTSGVPAYANSPIGYNQASSVGVCRIPYGPVGNRLPLWQNPVSQIPICPSPIYQQPIYTPSVSNWNTNVTVNVVPYPRNPLNPGQYPYVQNPLNPIVYPVNPYANPYSYYRGY